MTGRHHHGHVTTCGCGKRGWLRRKDAKHAAKELAGRSRSQTDRGHLDVYRCKLTDSDLFHIGHLPPVVVQGRARRDQIVTRPRAATNYRRGEPLS